jgi:hypothetical protein
MRTWKEVIQQEMMDCDSRDVERLTNDEMVEWAMKLWAKEVIEEMEQNAWEYIELNYGDRYGCCSCSWEWSNEYKQWRETLK